MQPFYGVRPGVQSIPCCNDIVQFLLCHRRREMLFQYRHQVGPLTFYQGPELSVGDRLGKGGHHIGAAPGNRHGAGVAHHPVVPGQLFKATLERAIEITDRAIGIEYHCAYPVLSPLRGGQRSHGNILLSQF